MSEDKTKYFKNTKIFNTLCLSKLINQLERSEGSLFINTLTKKHYKNELDAKYAFYICLHSCEIKSNSANSFVVCINNCDIKIIT